MAGVSLGSGGQDIIRFFVSLAEDGGGGFTFSQIPPYELGSNMNGRVPSFDGQRYPDTLTLN